MYSINKSRIVTSKKKHLNIVSGFLGSGKTTAIIEYIRQRSESERILVLVNEFGENDIDGHQYELSSDGKYKTWKIAGGCICCVSRVVFSKKLIDAGRSDFDRVIIEPSGLARASDLVDLVDRTTLKSVFEIHPVLCFVHPKMLTDGHVIREPLVREQLEVSDVIVGNFYDQMTDSDDRRFKDAIKNLSSPKMEIVTTQFGRVEPALFVARSPTQLPRSFGSKGLLSALGRKHYVLVTLGVLRALAKELNQLNFLSKTSFCPNS